MYRKTVAALLAALSIFVLAACASEQKNGETLLDEDMAVSGEPAQTDNSSPEETSDAIASDAHAADDNISWQGDPTWDFTAEMADGTSFTLSEQAGKAVLVNFWATWCGPCVQELPDIAELYVEYAGGGEAEIILVNCGESAEAVDAFLERNGYALPVAYDPATTIAGAYGVNAIPRTVVFGRDGTVVADYTGSRDYDTFKSAINGALGG